MEDLLKNVHNTAVAFVGSSYGVAVASYNTWLAANPNMAVVRITPYCYQRYPRPNARFLKTQPFSNADATALNTAVLAFTGALATTNQLFNVSRWSMGTTHYAAVDYFDDADIDTNLFIHILLVEYAPAQLFGKK